MFRLSAQTTRKAVQRLAVQTRSQSTNASAAGSSLNAKNVSMAAAAVATVGAVAYATMDSVDANMLADGLHAPKFPWEHKQNLATFDHAA
ncbi:hypothetical protein BGW38_008089 [Lunasporangiospora selenospora]|uniref:Uncharacterized protein n=1 Tax=Lunasporangiospora selenospora TaxID=979761 RepID=A0A9P6KGN1_9FUNG|nr:hypothetical protein BGW38_008089 [Lunasporangiospora selenospora]